MNQGDKLEAVELEVWKNEVHRRFIIAYNPPGNKPNLVWLEAIWDSKCLLYGDLNAPSIRWGYSQTDSVGRLWENFIDSNSVTFIDHNGSAPTFLSYAGHTSHPDVILAHPSLAAEADHILLDGPGSCGHKLLLLKSAISSCVHSENRRVRWNLKKANWHEFEKCSNILITKDLLTKNVDKAYCNIKEAILKCAQHAIPRGCKKRYAPFWNDSLQRLKLDRDEARKKAERTGCSSDRILLKQKCALLKRNIISAKRETYRNFLEHLDFRKDGVQAHNFISNLNNERICRNQPMNWGGKLLTREQDIAKAFCKHYCEVSNYKPKRTNGKPSIRLPQICLQEEEQFLFNDNFSMTELELALKKTKKNKSAGPDELLPEFLIHLGLQAKKVVLEFTNTIWQKGIPAEWRKAEVVPRLKKGKSPDSPKNFRPVALTSVFCKLIERIVLTRLQLYLEKNKSISDNQAGFRTHRSTTEQVIRMSDEIKNGFQHKQSTLAVFVDFRAAFDHVWRKLLLQKLSNMGLHGNLYRFISSFLAQRFLRVRYNDARSPFKQTKQGLPQGSVLSPTLFNVMINDVIVTLENIPGVNAMLYADDLVIWATSSNIKALQSCLNNSLVALSSWANANEMPVNVDKTVSQLFTLSTKRHNVLLEYEGQPVSSTNEATYLGFKMDGRLNWVSHIDSLIRKGGKRLNLLKRLTGVKWGASSDVLTLAYKTYVRPAIEYGGEVLITASDSAVSKISRVQNSALRIITGGTKSTPITAMELQAGIEPVKSRQETAALIMHERLKRTGISYWENVNPPSRRLKTQDSFSHKVKELTAEKDLHMENREKFVVIPECMSTSWYLPTAALELVREVKKDETPQYEMKAIALETIHRRYPSPPWTHIYTDGSAEAATRNAGAGAFSALFQKFAPVGRLATNFDGEVSGVRIALEEASLHAIERMVIFVDSKAAIIAITSQGSDTSEELRNCKAIAHRLIMGGSEIVLQWIPGHCGIEGNENADRLAKEGTQMQQPDNNINYYTAKREIRNKIAECVKREQEMKAEAKSWAVLMEKGGRLPTDLTRREAVAAFRLLTGHDYMQKHLHRIGVVSAPLCVLCGHGEMDGTHLETCSELQDVRDAPDRNTYKYKSDLYWAARSRMASVATI